MSVRIRVYPQYGGLGMNGLGMNGMNGGAVSASTYYNSRLSTQKQVSSLQLGYERALAGERIERARMEERLKNPYLSANAGYGGAFAGAYGGLPIGVGLGGLPLGGGVPISGGLPMGTLPMGGIPQGFGGAGQSNVTNQTSLGAGNQSVTNSNVNNVSHAMTAPPMYGGYGGGWGQPQFGGGGFLSGLLGALI